MAMKFQHEIRQSVGLWSDVDEQELKLQQKARGSPPEEDLESNVSTNSGGNALDTEVGEDCDGDANTSALVFPMIETLVIIDWDDTLLPTAWLQRESLIPKRSTHGHLCRQHGLTMEQQGQLQALAEFEERTLRLAKEHGSLIIVTNGEKGWVQYSCKRYLPALVPLLRDVQIVSARSTYEPFGHNPDMWKCLAFQKLINNFYGPHFLGKQRNVLSLGDSMHEHKALLYATHGIPNCRAKFLKFKERPHVTCLMEEHEFLAKCLQWTIHHDGDLDLEIAEESSL